MSQCTPFSIAMSEAEVASDGGSEYSAGQMIDEMMRRNSIGSEV